MNNLHFSYKTVNDYTILIDPGNRLDNNNAHEMVETISTAQTNGYTHIIVNMKNLDFISSAGVGSILGAVEAARAAGGDIVLCHVAEAIEHILNVLDLTGYFTIKVDTQEAAEFCGAGSKG
jgi:anti-anti-sigma factor